MKSRSLILSASVAAFAFAAASVAHASPLAGKKVSILGDSISTYLGTSGCDNSYYGPSTSNLNERSVAISYALDDGSQWWQLVLAEQGATLEKNVSCGGSAMSCGGNYSSFLTRAKSTGLGSPDAIFIMGGANDDWVYKKTASAFRSGVKEVFDYLDTTYPNAAKYVVLLGTNCTVNGSANYLWGLNVLFRTNQIEEAKSRSNYKVIDLAGTYPSVKSYGDKSSWTHPNKSGLAAIASCVSAAINADEPEPTDSPYVYSKRDWSNAIVCWGDSLTRGCAADTVTASDTPTNYFPGLISSSCVHYQGYPFLLAKRLEDTGRPVFTLADDGCTRARVLAASWSALPELTADYTLVANAKNAEGASVSVEMLYPWLRATMSNSGTAVRANGRISGSFFVDGSQIRAYWFAGKKFLALGSENGVTIPSGTKFVTDVSRMFKSAINVVLLGTNDGGVSSAYFTAVSNFANGVDGGRYVIISPHCYNKCSTNTYSTWHKGVVSSAAKFEACFGEHHLNLIDLLDTKGLATAVELGVMTQAEADAAGVWYANDGSGLLNAIDDLSKLADLCHFNQRGYAVVEKFLYDKLVDLGYLDGSACTHSWGEWVVTKAATETTTGTKERTCSKCGKVQTAVIPVVKSTGAYKWNGGASGKWANSENWTE